MSRIRVAVTGSGGGVGQSIIKSLQNTDYEVVALDGDVLATGLYAASRSHIIPYSNRPEYIESLIDICQANDCKVLFPALDAESAILSKNIDASKNAGIKVIVSSEDVIEISNDKMKTFTELIKLGVEVPTTIDLENTSVHDVDLEFPFVLKERRDGARSQNLYIVKNKEEVQSLVDRSVDFTKYIAQEYIEGDEYTCGSINLDGECKGVIVMRRILRDGDTYKAFSVKDATIEEAVRKVTNGIKPFGACNIQLRVRDGKVYIIEINARCSGTTASRSLCGFNEPKMILDYITRGIEPAYEIKEQTILRYWNELVVSNEQVDTLKRDKTISSEGHASL